MGCCLNFEKCPFTYCVVLTWVKCNAISPGVTVGWFGLNVFVIPIAFKFDTGVKYQKLHTKLMPYVNDNHHPNCIQDNTFCFPQIFESSISPPFPWLWFHQIVDRDTTVPLLHFWSTFHLNWGNNDQIWLPKGHTRDFEQCLTLIYCIPWIFGGYYI